jgi:hypothetical protein
MLWWVASQAATVAGRSPLRRYQRQRMRYRPKHLNNIHTEGQQRENDVRGVSTQQDKLLSRIRRKELASCDVAAMLEYQKCSSYLQH